MKTIWIKSGNDYFQSESSNQQSVLNSGIYKVEHSEIRGLYLTYINDVFTFPYKIYGTEDKFISRVKKTYDNSTGNFGVLLNGVKGTGKTVTAELICNELSLPIIIVNQYYDELVSFLNSFQQNIVVFIDEFEKIYDGYDNSLLSIMDGAMKTQYRLFFLLTTNELSIEKNLIQRPSRIRYIKTFENLSIDLISEIVNDLLIYPEYKEEIIIEISKLPIITIDLIKGIVAETNIHNEPPSSFMDILNVHELGSTRASKVTKITKYETTVVSDYGYISPSKFTDNRINDSVYLDGTYLGTLKKIISKELILLSIREDMDIAECVKSKSSSKTKRKNVIINDIPLGENEALYKVEPVNSKHYAFWDYMA